MQMVLSLSSSLSSSSRWPQPLPAANWFRCTYSPLFLNLLKRRRKGIWQTLAPLRVNTMRSTTCYSLLVADGLRAVKEKLIIFQARSKEEQWQHDSASVCFKPLHSLSGSNARLYHSLLYIALPFLRMLALLTL
jgi:hypothetical protein